MQKSFYERVFDLLAEHAKTPNDQYDKESFTHAFSREQVFGVDDEEGSTVEYRIGGLLGFGGKFWRNPYPGRCPYYVNFYPEDRTPEREHLASMLNTLIEDAWLQHISPEAKKQYLRRNGDAED